MLTDEALGQSAGESRRYAQGSAISGILALALMVFPLLLSSPEVRVRLIVERPLKLLESFELLPLMGVAVLLLSLSALLLGYLGRPRLHHLAVVGLVTGAAATALLVLSVTLSTLLGRLWLPGFSLAR
jgi:hypothetical protein